MPVPSTFADLSTTPASNSPAGSDSPTVIDDHQRTLYAFIASIYANSGNGWSSPYLTTANPSYTGTLTGGTGVVNLGSGQFYKAASGYIGVGTTSPSRKVHISGSGAQGSTTAAAVRLDNTSSARSAIIDIDDSQNLNIWNSDAGSGAIVFLTSAGAGTARFSVKPAGQCKFYPLSSAPTGAEEGDIYYDSTAKKHYGYNGTSWNALY